MQRLLICIVFLTFLFAAKAQVRKSMSEKFENFDFHGLIDEFSTTKNLTTDELVLGAKTYYRLGDFKNAELLIDSVENLVPLSPRLICFQSDIKTNRIREMIGAPKFEASLISKDSDGSSMASAILGERLLISKSGPAKGMLESKDIQTDLGFLKLYETSLSNKQLKNFKLLLQKKSSNIGPICSYKEGYVLTENYIEKKAQRNLKISFLDSAFNTVESFPFNDPSYSIGHACYDEQRERLIFVSDMPKGDGVTNLWYSQMLNGEWQVPVQMEFLNTPGNEMFPTIYGDVLYFSSNGRIGYGGLDIYSINLNDSSELNISHLPSPINSRYDDFGLLWIEKDREALLNSNRLNQNKDLVYKIVVENGTFGCENECSNESCRQFSIQEFEEMDYDRFMFSWDFGDGKMGTGIFSSHCYSSAGTFTVKLSVKDLETNVTEKDIMVEEIVIKDLVANFPMFEIESSEVGSPVVITDNLKAVSGNTDRILWETSDGQSTFSQSPNFVFETPGYHWIKRSVKIITESDCCYSSFRNFVYIKPKAVDSLQQEFDPTNTDIAFSNNEELYPVNITFERLFPNERIAVMLTDLTTQEEFQIETTDDTLALLLKHDHPYEFRAINSASGYSHEILSSVGKTEFEYGHYHIDFSTDKRPILILDENRSPLSSSKVTVNDVKRTTSSSGIIWSEISGNSVLDVSLKGYLTHTSKTSNTSNDTIVVVLQKLELNKAIQLDNIYFDLNKYNIREDAALILDILVKTLNENPGLHLKLNAHTDSRGSDTSNQVLSDQRAKSAITYITNNGIDGNRLEGEGFGESLLRNNCSNGVNCSKEQHQLNRRVEVVVTKL